MVQNSQETLVVR